MEVRRLKFGRDKCQCTKAYTGSEVKQKLYRLDFTDSNGRVRLNAYGANGDIAYD